MLFCGIGCCSQYGKRIQIKQKSIGRMKRTRVEPCKVTAIVTLEDYNNGTPLYNSISPNGFYTKRK